MKNTPYDVVLDAEEGAFDLKEILAKYLRYWPWFLGTVLLCLLAGYIYLRYAPVIYYSEATIKVLQEEEENVLSLSKGSLMGNSGVNLQNEILVLKSQRLLSQVVDSLNLDIDYYEVGTVKTRQTWQPPFQGFQTPN